MGAEIFGIRLNSTGSQISKMTRAFQIVNH